MSTRTVITNISKHLWELIQTINLHFTNYLQKHALSTSCLVPNNDYVITILFMCFEFISCFDLYLYVMKYLIRVCYPAPYLLSCLGTFNLSYILHDSKYKVLILSLLVHVFLTQLAGTHCGSLSRLLISLTSWWYALSVSLLIIIMSKKWPYLSSISRAFSIISFSSSSWKTTLSNISSPGSHQLVCKLFQISQLYNSVLTNPVFPI